jgi:hypothetical protein
MTKKVCKDDIDYFKVVRTNFFGTSTMATKMNIKTGGITTFSSTEAASPAGYIITESKA